LKSLHVLIRAMNIYRPGTAMEMEWGKHGDAWLLERQNHPYRMKAKLNTRGYSSAATRLAFELKYPVAPSMSTIQRTARSLADASTSMS
jgi:hypothetical protein